MDKTYILILTVIFIATEIELTTSAVYYSGLQNETYQNSSLHCRNMGGYLLTYGELLLSAAETCNAMYAWTAAPWYNRRDCYHGDPDKEKIFETEENHLAVCADFCSNKDYTAVGIWTSKCQCYSAISVSNLTKDFDDCATTLCPGNTGERCALNSSAVIFDKVQQSGKVCRYRKFKDRSTTGVTEHRALCDDRKPFICKVGQSNTILCSLDALEPSTEELSSSNNTGVVVGVVVGIIILAAVIVGALLFIRHRRHSGNME